MEIIEVAYRLGRKDIMSEHQQEDTASLRPRKTRKKLNRQPQLNLIHHIFIAIIISRLL